MTSLAGRPALVGRALPSRWGLRLGLVVLTAVTLLNGWAYLSTDEPTRPDLRHSPSHILMLQRALGPEEVTDTVVQGLSLLGAMESAGVRRVFLSMPDLTAIVGERYEYQASTLEPLHDFSLSGVVPAELQIDPQSGAVTGVPSRPGRYDLVVGGTTNSGARAEQRFALFVDDRFLWLGSDGLGRDIVRRIGSAMRFTMVPGFIAALVGVGLGVLLGAFAGFYGGVAQRVQRGVTAVVQSQPALLVIFLAAAAVNYRVLWLMPVVGALLLPETANGVAERVESFRRREFVEAARELGMSDPMILWNEIIWHNARAFILSRVSQAFVYALLVEVTLSYLGVADDTVPQLGSMLKAGREDLMANAGSTLAFATLGMILLIIAAFSLVERGVLQRWERTP